MSEEDNYEEFNIVLNDLKDSIISLDITNHEDIFFKHQTKGTTSEQYSIIKNLTDSENVVAIHNLVYEGMKYMFMKNILEENKAPVYIFISTDSDKEGSKRGMFITSFFEYSFIATFDHKKINTVTSKIVSVIDQYQAEE